MEYQVTCLPKEEFLRLWDLVLIARDGLEIPRQYQPVALYRVSERLEDFSEMDRPAIAGDEFVGMYYHDGQIWLKWDQFFHDLQDTSLHELSHHEVPHEAHGPTWRKVFGTSFALHLRECGHEWGDIDRMLYSDVVARYRVFRKIEDPVEQQRILQAEVKGIIRHAKTKMRVLTERGKR